jgi:RNA polymerase sigma factor (sigma-70 family)
MGKEPDHTYSNDELMDGIIKGDHGVFRFVADQALPYVLKNMGKEGSKEKAEEIVQDACIVVYRKATSGQLQLRCRFMTYFYAVCRNILNYSYRSKEETEMHREGYAELSEAEEEEIEMLWMRSREYRLYRRHFDDLKVKQRNILASSMDGVPYRELFAQFGFKSEDAFKNEVFRIRKKLFQQILEDPEFILLKNRTYWSYDE